MSGLAIFHLAFSLTTLPSDTPPQLPVPLAQLATIKSAQDVIAITLLADGSRAPDDLQLPQLDNQLQTLQFMRVHYPESLRHNTPRPATIAWIYVDAAGKVGRAQLLTGSGHAALDSLSLNVLRIASFRPARHKDKAVGVWMPFPAAIPQYEELIATLESAGRDVSEAPTEVAHTQKPVLLNRNQVESAIVRIVHQLNPNVRAQNEMFARAQTAGGVAHLNIYIDVDGAVRNVLVKKTTGNPDLDSSAQNIARMMRFSPARNGDQPVAVWLEVPIRFKAN